MKIGSANVASELGIKLAIGLKLGLRLSIVLDRSLTNISQLNYSVTRLDIRKYAHPHSAFYP